MRNETNAYWDVQLWLYCPHCKEYIDYMEAEDEGITDMGIVPCESRENVNIEFECPECGRLIVIKDVSY